MAAPDPEGTASEPAVEVRAGAKRAFLESLDAKLAAAGYPVRAPVPATPPPALTFEAWAELSVRFAGAPPGDLAAALAARGLTPEVWKRFDDAYRRALSDDLRAGQRERPALYDARYKAEQARRAVTMGTAPPEGAPAAAMPPALPAPEPAPADLRATNGAPDLPAAVLATLGRMPFVPPAPAPAAPRKRAATTAASEPTPSPVGGADDGPRRRPAAADAQPALRRDHGRRGRRLRAGPGRPTVRGAPRRARAPAGAPGGDAEALQGAERGGAPRARGALAAPGTARRAGDRAGGFRGRAAPRGAAVVRSAAPGRELVGLPPGGENERPCEKERAFEAIVEQELEAAFSDDVTQRVSGEGQRIPQPRHR